MQQSMERDAALGAALKSMRALSILGLQLAALPASRSDGSGPRAGISFAMMRCSEGLGASGMLDLPRERARELEEHVDALPLAARHKEELGAALRSLSETLRPPRRDGGSGFNASMAAWRSARQATLAPAGPCGASTPPRRVSLSREVREAPEMTSPPPGRSQNRWA
jgi:hypothetical protein